jgi:hypothetical protein
MIVKTKRYELPKNTYIKIGLMNQLRATWWYGAGPIAVILLGLLVFNDEKWWFISAALLVTIGYALFWWIQYAGVTQLEQSKILFEKLSYEIDSRQILIKLNAKQGSPMQWTMITKAEKNKDHFLLIINKGQFIMLPFSIFTSENDIKFLEAILKRKELLK